MFSKPTVFQRFADLVSGPEQNVRLGEAALIIASEFNEEPEVERYLEWMQTTAAELPFQNDIHILAEYFHEQWRFRGDGDNYYDPKNSLLDQVIERRLGIPITLSILLIEIGRINGYQLEGVGFPGHFMVRDSEVGFYIDPFHHCEILDEAGARRRVMSLLGQSKWQENWVRAATPRQILFRLLTNLKLILLERQEYSQAAAVQEKLLVLAPARPQEYRDLGVVAASAGDWAMSRKFLREYLQMKPEAEDAELVRTQLQRLVDEIARRN